MFGSDCLKTCSQRQETIVLSSGESECYGIVKAATLGIGIKSMFRELGFGGRGSSKYGHKHSEEYFI